MPPRRLGPLVLAILCGCTAPEEPSGAGDNAGTANAEAPASSAAPAGPVARAVDLIRRDRAEDAVALLREALEADPDDRQALAVLIGQLEDAGLALAREGRWDRARGPLAEAAALVRRLRDRAPEPTAVERGLTVATLYNEACAESRAGDPGRALEILEEALRAGFLDATAGRGASPRELFLTDPDLDAARAARPDRFAALRREYLGADDGPTP